MSSVVASLAYNALSETVTGGHVSSPLRIALSGVSGSISLACWIVLLLPQLIEQWRLKSADGISPVFLSIWFLGDVANLLGSLWADLLPQVTFLAVWFCFADFAVLSSYIYYTRIYPKKHAANVQRQKSLLNSVASNTPDEHTSLIQSTDEQQPIASRKSKSSRKSSRRRRSSALDDIINETSSNASIFSTYVLPIAFVFLAGFIGYLSSSKLASDTPTDPSIPDEPEVPGKIDIGPQILGYISAVLYLTARLPQIYQNHVKKSCKGLSLLFFIFSTLGNITYALQILFYRSDSEYVLLNLSWLLGSLGTIFEDLIIFIQFYMFKDHPNSTSVIEEEV